MINLWSLSIVNEKEQERTLFHNCLVDFKSKANLSFHVILLSPTTIAYPCLDCHNCVFRLLVYRSSLI